jgi:hypothetical protein
MGLNYPIILQSRFSGRKDKAPTPLREKDGQVWRRLDGGPGIRGGEGRVADGERGLATGAGYGCEMVARRQPR